MRALTIILSIIIFIKTLSYGIYEFKSNNKNSGIVIIGLAVLSLFFPIFMIFFRGV